MSAGVRTRDGPPRDNRRASDLIGLQVLQLDRERETLSLRRSEWRSPPFTLRREDASDRSAAGQPDAGNGAVLPTHRVEKPDA